MKEETKKYIEKYRRLSSLGKVAVFQYLEPDSNIPEYVGSERLEFELENSDLKSYIDSLPKGLFQKERKT